jgi:hypothetical protein
MTKYGKPSDVAPPSRRRDVGMIETGKDFAYLTKPPKRFLTASVRSHDFDRHGLAVEVVGADGEVDRPHAAASQLAKNIVVVDAVVDAPALHSAGVASFVAGLEGIPIEERSRVAVRVKKTHDLHA